FNSSCDLLDLPAFPTRRSSDLILPRLGSELLDGQGAAPVLEQELEARRGPESGDGRDVERKDDRLGDGGELLLQPGHDPPHVQRDRKSTRLNSSHDQISYAVFC